MQVTLDLEKHKFLGISIVGQNKTHEERWYRPLWYEMGQTIPTEREAILELDLKKIKT